MLQYKQEKNLYLIAIIYYTPNMTTTNTIQSILTVNSRLPRTKPTLEWGQKEFKCLQEKGNTIIGGRESSSIVDLHRFIHFCSFNARFFYILKKIFFITPCPSTNWSWKIESWLLDNNNRYNEIQQMRRHMPCNIPTPSTSA